MKRYTVAEVRQRLASALDEAERGEPVVIERSGVRFSLVVERPQPARRRQKPRIEILDDAVAAGQWTWTWTNRGLRFKPRTRSRR